MLETNTYVRVGEEALMYNDFSLWPHLRLGSRPTAYVKVSYVYVSPCSQPGNEVIMRGNGVLNYWQLNTVAI